MTFDDHEPADNLSSPDADSTQADAMVGDMFTVQELNAVLLSRESESAA